MSTKTRRKLRFILGFAGFFTALWFLWDTPLVYPLKIFVVLLHELSHAAAAVATGGGVQRIVLDPRQGGACYCPGGNAFLTLSAGYLGSLAWGGLMFSAARSGRIRKDWLNAMIGAVVMILTLLYVRTLFGIVFGVAFGLALITTAKYAGTQVNRGLLFAMGLTSALYAILDIKSDVLDRPLMESDAHMLADITGVPTLVWGVLWIGVAIAFCVWLLRGAYRDA